MQYNRQKQNHGGQLPKGIRQNDGILSTAEILAEKHVVSPRTLEREGATASVIEDNGIPELVKKVGRGEVPVNVALLTHQMEQKQEQPKSLLWQKLFGRS